MLLKAEQVSDAQTAREPVEEVSCDVGATNRPNTSDFGQRRRTLRKQDRFAYDDEERYAILHLRITCSKTWAEIERDFQVLFPPGLVRRVNEAGVPPYYITRMRGALECRYYRLREDLGLSQMRQPGHDPDMDVLAIDQLLKGYVVSEPFLAHLKIVANQLLKQ